LTSHFQSSRENLYLGAVMEVAEVSSKEGWRAKGVDQDEVRKDIKAQLGGAMPIIDKLIEDAGDWFLYPVYRIPPKGSWATEKVMLLGDTAHAVRIPFVAYSKYSDGRWPGSPHKICPDLLLSRCHRREKGVGMVLQDVVVFARLVGCYGAARLNDIFARYEELQRKRIDAAYDEANLRWDTNKDFAWLAQSMKEWLVPIFL